MIRALSALLLVAAVSAGAFDRALPGYRYEFPRDHFAHPSFQIEWWYFTGNLKTAEGRRFGFELTFFRNAIERERPLETPWDVDQIYLAHFAVSDIEGERFFKNERLNRAGPGLAGASLEQSRMWNGNWEARRLDPADPDSAWRLRAVGDAFSIDLEARPAKPPVIHGVDGVSRKADGEGKASHYVSLTRLVSEGEIRVGAERFAVEGLAWMDHEFSTDSLGEGQAGWDWLSAQFDDGSELMLYRMRRSDGSVDRNSSATYVAPDGRTRHLGVEEYEMVSGRVWSSPRTGGVYPVEWGVRVPSLGLDLRVTTPLESQEVVAGRSGGPSYWEGAVDYQGTRGDEPLRGVGYLEMTGYDRELKLGVDAAGQAADPALQ